MSGRPGLNLDTPSTFVEPPKPKAQESRLHRRLAYYMAHAIENQRAILGSDLWDENAIILLLYLLEKDSESEADATEFDTVYPDTYKAGEATFEEQYKYYATIDRNVLYELSRFLSDKLFSDNNAYRYFHSAPQGWTDFRFVSEAGKYKLKADWPHIWESFGFDKDQPKVVEST
jgi:hypothetical protein